MRSLNRFLGISALIMVVVLIGSIIFTSTYISTHRDLLSNLGVNWQQDGMRWNWPFSSGERSSRYETLTDEASANFSLPTSMVINAGTNTLNFIEEDRTDILVEYISQYPDTPLYQTDYSAKMENTTLYITNTTTIKGLYLDKDYDSEITIHVPKDFILDTLDLTMSMGEIHQDSVMDHVNNLILSANLGDIDLDIDSPKDSISVDCAMGGIKLDINAPVDKIDCEASFGEVNLNLDDQVGTLRTDADMGSINITADSDVKSVELTAQMGSITGDFGGSVDKLDASCDMGSITLEIDDLEGITAYVDADMGSVDVADEIDLIKDSREADYQLSAQMGDIKIRSK